MKQEENNEFLVKLNSLEKSLIALYNLEQNPKTKEALQAVSNAIKTIKTAPVEEVEEEEEETVEEEEKDPLLTVKPLEKELSSKDENIEKKLTADLQEGTVGIEHKNKETGVETSGSINLDEKSVELSRKNEKTGIETTAGVNFDEKTVDVTRKNENTGIETSANINFEEKTAEISRKKDGSDIEKTAKIDLEKKTAEISRKKDGSDIEKTAKIDLEKKTVELGRKNEVSGTENSVGINFEEQSMSLASENKEKGLAFNAELSKAGIKAGMTQEVEFEFDKGEFGKGLIKVQPTLGFKAKLAVGAEATEDGAGLSATLNMEANANLDVFLDLALVELGGSIEFSYKTGLSASVYLSVKGEKVFRLDPSNHRIDLGFSLFVRPGDTLIDLLDFVQSFLDDEKDAEPYDKTEMAWVIDLGSVNLMNLTIPGVELKFGDKLKPGLDLPKIVERELANVQGGFIGTVVKVVKWVKDAIAFIEGIIDDIGAFFEAIWDSLVDAIGKVFDGISELMKTDKERLEEYLKGKGQRDMGIIFAKGVERMKEQPKHVKALHNLPLAISKHMYVFTEVWPEVKADPFVKQSFEAVAKGDYALLDKNAQIAEAAFEVVNSAVTGVKVDDAFVAGEDLNVALDLRQVTTLTKEFFDKLAGRTEKIDGCLEVVLLHNGTVVSKKVVIVSEMLDFLAPVSNAYTAHLLVPADKDLAEAADWAVRWKVDFVGEIMDVKGDEIPITVTYQQPQDMSGGELEQTIAIPTIGKLRTKGKRVKDKQGKKAYPQGSEVSVNIPVELSQLPPDTEFITGVAYTKLIYNGKAIGKSPKKTFRIMPRHVEKDGRNVETKVSIPKSDNYEDSALGGVWKVVSYIKIEGMTDKERRGTSIRVFNNNKQYTALDATQSIAAPEDLKENESSEATPDDSNMSHE